MGTDLEALLNEVRNAADEFYANASERSHAPGIVNKMFEVALTELEPKDPQRTSIAIERATFCEEFLFTSEDWSMILQLWDDAIQIASESNPQELMAAVGGKLEALGRLQEDGISGERLSEHLDDAEALYEGAVSLAEGSDDRQGWSLFSGKIGEIEACDLSDSESVKKSLTKADALFERLEQFEDGSALTVLQAKARILHGRSIKIYSEDLFDESMTVLEEAVRLARTWGLYSQADLASSTRTINYWNRWIDQERWGRWPDSELDRELFYAGLESWEESWRLHVENQDMASEDPGLYEELKTQAIEKLEHWVATFEEVYGEEPDLSGLPPI